MEKIELKKCPVRCFNMQCGKGVNNRNYKECDFYKKSLSEKNGIRPYLWLRGEKY